MTIVISCSDTWQSSYILSRSAPGKAKWMRVSRQMAAENRERIVDTAARLFREKGFNGLDEIMNGAGLTHGGFYGHFGSKEDLAAEAVLRALRRSAERKSRFTRVRTQLEPPDQGGGKNDAGKEVSRQLVVTGGDAAKVLEPAKTAAGSAYARPRIPRRSAPLGRRDLTQFAVRE